LLPAFLNAFIASADELFSWAAILLNSMGTDEIMRGIDYANRLYTHIPARFTEGLPIGRSGSAEIAFYSLLF
jgi:hypothetical protein